MPFTQQEADDNKLPLELCNKWEEWMQEFWTCSIDIFVKKGKMKIENKDNSIWVLNDYEIKINIVNSKWLEINIEYKTKEIASAYVCGKKEELVPMMITLMIQHMKNESKCIKKK